MSEYKLKERILLLSVADDWDRAKLEWVIAEIHREDEPDTCLCGHFPINEICLIRNTKNAKTSIVGNCCVKKFGMPSGKIFAAIKRITADDTKAPNIEIIAHAREKKWITQWEYDFSVSTLRMRKNGLSDKQIKKRVQINKRLLREVVNSRGSA